LQSATKTAVCKYERKKEKEEKKKKKKKTVQAVERFIVVSINIKIHARLLQKYSLLPGSELNQ